MQKINLYVYPNAKAHVHDSIPNYVNTVPLSKQGIEKWANLVGPAQADYFYMGQISDSYNLNDLVPQKFKYFRFNQERHIADIEGDWLGKEIPRWLKPAILTINGAPFSYTGFNLFVRPTFSTNLVTFAKNIINEPPEIRDSFINHSFHHDIFMSFRGFPDPHGIRHKVMMALQGSKITNYEYKLMPKWLGPADYASAEAESYRDLMRRTAFALCPRGCGHDSARFYEACYFGCVPIIIGDNRVVGEDIYDTSFVQRISQYKSVEDIRDMLHNIWSCHEDFITKLRKSSYDYFRDIIVMYFKDPTKMFLQYLVRLNASRAEIPQLAKVGSDN